MRYMGIDYGTKKVGTALSDDSGAMGFPYKVFGNDARLLDTLISIVSTERIKVIVIGESRNYAGNDNPVALQARGLGDVLGQATGIPVVYEPEMLTRPEAGAKKSTLRQPHSSLLAIYPTRHERRKNLHR